MCLWKTWTGSWTTSFRMHEQNKLTCSLGCRDSDDSLLHYLHCPVLWQIVGETVQQVPPHTLSERLCLMMPSQVRFRMLALAFQGYHHLKSLNLYSADMEAGNFC